MKLYEQTEWREGSTTYVQYDFRPAHRLMDWCSGLSIAVMLVTCTVVLYRMKERLRNEGQ